MPVNLHLFLFQSWPLASEQHHSRSPLRASHPGPPSRYCTVCLCNFFMKNILQHRGRIRANPSGIHLNSYSVAPDKRSTFCFHLLHLFQSPLTHLNSSASLSPQSPIKAWKASEPGQWKTECEKRRERREEQCLSNTEWVAGHICPCRVCEGEQGGREVLQHSLFSLSRSYPQRFIWEMFPKSHLSVFTRILLLARSIRTQDDPSFPSCFFSGSWDLKMQPALLNLDTVIGQSWNVPISRDFNPIPMHPTVTSEVWAAQLPFASLLILLAPPWKEMSSWMERGELRGCGAEKQCPVYS